MIPQKQRFIRGKKEEFESWQNPNKEDYDFFIQMRNQKKLTITLDTEEESFKSVYTYYQRLKQKTLPFNSIPEMFKHLRECQVNSSEGVLIGKQTQNIRGFVIELKKSDKELAELCYKVRILQKENYSLREEINLKDKKMQEQLDPILKLLESSKIRNILREDEQISMKKIQDLESKIERDEKHQWSNFRCRGNQITLNGINKAKNQQYHQILLTQVLKENSKLEVHVKNGTSMIIGVVDKEKKNQYESSKSGHAICYYCPGVIYYGLKGKLQTKQTRDSIVPGCVLVIKIDKNKGIASFSVRDMLGTRHYQVTTDILLQAGREFVPYFQMRQKDDSVFWKIFEEKNMPRGMKKKILSLLKQKISLKQTSIELKDSKIVDNQILEIQEQPYKFVKHANLQKNQLTNLDLIMKKFPNVETLNLQNNQFYEIKISESYESLREFNLSSNFISFIDSRSLEKLSNIRSLDLSQNKISEFPSNFQKMKSLQSLNICNNKLTELPSDFQKLQNLKILNLGNNKLTELPNNFQKLQNLEILNLSSNNLKKLPLNFGQLTKLTNLHVSKNKLQQLPDSFQELSKLQNIDANGNELMKLSYFGKMIKLHTLDLSNNKLKSLLSLEELKNLEKLDVSQNRLKQLSDFKIPPGLKTLNLSQNPFQSLPSSLGKLKQLHTLQIRFNKLKKLPSFQQLRSLETLDLSDGYLSFLPQQLGSLVNLQTLKVNRNQLSKLCSLTQLINLRILQASDNKLSELSPIIFFFKIIRNIYFFSIQKITRKIFNQPFYSLEKLEKLDLSKNQLSHLPDGFEVLENLQVLNISRNNIDKLPDSVVKLKKLTMLTFDQDKINDENSLKIVDRLKSIVKANRKN